ALHRALRTTGCARRVTDRREIAAFASYRSEVSWRVFDPCRERRGTLGHVVSPEHDTRQAAGADEVEHRDALLARRDDHSCAGIRDDIANLVDREHRTDR